MITFEETFARGSGSNCAQMKKQKEYRMNPLTRHRPKIPHTLLLLALVAACSGNDTSEGTQATAFSLVEGRQFDVMVPETSGGDLVQLSAEIGEDAGHFATVHDALSQSCDVVNGRASQITVRLSDRRYLGETVDASAHSLCMGHEWMNLANAVNVVDVYLDGTFATRPPLDPNETPTAQAERIGAARGLALVLPVPSSDSAATFAYLAVQAFQEGALTSAEILELAPANSLEATVLAGAEDGSGLTQDLSETTRLADVVVFQAAEGTQRMIEASRLAADLTSQVAQARTGGDGDRAQARYESWMGAHNSRYEIMGLWTGRPDCSCCEDPALCAAIGVPVEACYDPNWCARPDDTPPPRSEDCSCCDIDPLTCETPSMCDPLLHGICVIDEDPGDDPRDPGDDPGDFTCDPISDSEDAAVSVVAQLGRLPDAAASPARIIAELAESVREADPAAAMLSDREALEQTYGISTDSFVRAVRHTHQRIQTLGLPVVARAAGSQNVDGLSGIPSSEQLSAYTSARTIGENYFDYQQAIADEADYRVPGGGAWAVFNHHFVPFAYGRQGVLPALTVIAASLRKGLARSELAPDTVVPGRVEQDPSRRIAHTALRLARQFVPQFIKLNVGFGNDSGVERFQLRCYGCEGDASDYEIFVGESGLHCATTGSIAGHDCNEDDYRVNITPTRVNEPSYNGYADSFVDFLALSSNVPAHGIENGRIAPSHFYLTRKEGGAREVVTSFTPLEGPNGTGFTRTTYIPVTSQGIQIAGAAVQPSVNECEDPQLCCEDLPCDPQLPRESELISDRYGTNSYESIDEALRNLALQLTTEADSYGIEAINRQLSADQSAEAARGALEQLCGGVINVESALAPQQCAVNEDCDAGTCFGNLCYENLADAISSQDGPDTSSIEACLGGELANVNFGSVGLCYFQAADDSLPPCVCLDGEAECPVCPVQAPVGCSMDVFPGLGAAYVAESTRPMSAVESTVAPSSVACEDLAIVRGHSDLNTRVDAAERLLASAWLSHFTFSQLGERIGFEPGLFQMGRATINGNSWYASGTEAFGPTEEGQFPCGNHPLIVAQEDESAGAACADATSDWTFGPPLMCGAEFLASGSCENHENRIRLNARLRHAATLVSVLGGSSGRYLFAPGSLYYHLTGSGQAISTRDYEVAGDLWPHMDDGFPTFNYDAVDSEVLVPETSNPVSDWHCNNQEELDGTRCYRTVADSLLMRRCQDSDDSDSTCASTVPPSLNYPGGTLPAWLGFHPEEPPTTGRILGSTGQIFGTFHSGGAGRGLGDHFALWDDVSTYSYWDGGQVDPENELSARCVRLDLPVDEAEEHEAFAQAGALCPVMHAAVPVSFDALMVSRTSAQTLADFWSRGNFEEADAYTLRDFLMEVATRDGSRWDAVEDLELAELPQGRAPYGRVLDALELGCLAQQERPGAGCGIDVGSVPTVNGPSDFAALERSLSCTADTLEYGIQNATLFGVPASIADDIEDQELSATFPQLRGEYAIAANSLRSSAETVGMATNQMASAMRQLGSGIAIARHQLEIISLQLEIAHLNSIAAQAAAVANAASAAAKGVADWQLSEGLNLAGKIAGAAAATAQVAAQAVALVTAIKSYNLQEDISNEESAIIMVQLQQQFGQQIDSIASAANLAVQGYSQMQQATTQLESIRQQAAIQAMVVLGQTYDPVTGRENNFLQGQRRWTDLWLNRYHGAWRRARTVAWYARHALEAKIGMDLSEMHDDLSLVEAPHDWVDDLCRMKPLDYTALRDVAGEAEQTDPDDSAFLGDYVRMLGLVKQSYALDHAYQDEPDLLVLSMRDEVFDEVVQCDIEGHNLLYQSANASTMMEDGIGGWFPDFEEAGYAISTSPIPGSPFAQFALDDGTLVSRALGGAQAQRTFLVEPLVPVEPLAMQPAWRQSVELPAGRYALSWSEKVGDFDDETCAALMPLGPSLGSSVTGHDVDVPVLATSRFLTPEEDSNSHPCWRRGSLIVDNPVDQWVDVAFTIDAVWAAGDSPPAIDWAAPQLEWVSSASNIGDLLPTVFFPTDTDLSFLVGLCEDSTGGALRENFTYHCEALCPPEFGDNCDGGEYCYWESNFALDVDSLATGEGGQFGGIAARSYNHRLQSVAVNLVGSNVRDCERSSRPSVCYASGFLPYSLRADQGTIRNHYGEHVTPRYDPGNVEFARALSVERYITNPLSSADATLLSDYWRRSFHGYPLSALYRLRVIDVPELDWDAVADIQLVLRHTYYTHQR